MKNRQDTYKKFSKLHLNTFCIYFLFLMAPFAQAQDKSMDIKPLVDKFLLPSNASSQPELVVEKVPAEIKTIVEKELLSRIEIDKPELSSAMEQVFSSAIYKVKPLLDYMAVVNGEVLDLNYHGSSSILSGYLKLIREDFILDSEQKATLLANAFKFVFPNKLSGEIKPPIKIKNSWIVIKGKFFKSYSGLVFTTNENGKITLIEYVLKINPEDYSYNAPEDIT